MKNKKALFTAQAGLIAAAYVALTMLSAAFGLASSFIQVRISEAMCFLPFFLPAAVPGLTIGCLISNMLLGCIPADVVFGSAATLLGALGAYALGRLLHGSTAASYLSTLPNVVSNVLIIPWVLRFGYGVSEAVPFMMFTVGAGEVISCCLLGSVLLFFFRRRLSVLK